MNKTLKFAIGVMLVTVAAQSLYSATTSLESRRKSNISSSKHNLSTSGSFDVKSATGAGGTSQTCVFCHTPHAATREAGLASPLWNKTLSSATYTMYDSASVQATIDANPGGSSKLCLSCHDGTLAMGAVNVIEAQGTQTVTLLNTDAGTMPGDPTSGYTRDLGVNLTNDHPISFTYNAQLATDDEELYDPTNTVVGKGDQVGVRGSGLSPDQPRLPLEGQTVGSGKTQCTTCHDPHLVGDGTDDGAKIKFLRANRFQRDSHPTEGTYDEDTDIICLACHDKEGWAASAHARSDVATEAYNATDAQTREFYNTLDGDSQNMEVWEAACLNCHDTHTKQGARRLLREGSTGSSQANSAIEETCYQCHTAGGGILSTSNNQAPDINTDFTLAGNTHMPIETADQDVTTEEIHDIQDADFTETTTKLAQRHVECTDCHNPHRLKKTRKFSDTPTATEAAGTHLHTAVHSNIASGVLAGAFGVEPQYSNTKFNSDPVTTDSEITFASNNAVKQGTGVGCDTAGSDPDTCSYVTREYQICLKCHSNYAWGSSPPDLKSAAKGGSYNVNGVTEMTNQAMEFQAPIAHKGEGQNMGFEGGADAAYDTNNHRSWHPVMDDTGRSAATRRNDAVKNNWLSPWNTTAAVGSQTMYCSDCHGSDTANGTSIPRSQTGTDSEDGPPWGPHGSSNDFILKGWWKPAEGTAIPNNALCFKCHDTGYRDAGLSSSGFWDTDTGKDELHDYHNKQVGALRCNWCHIALPHGWKNKAFLVNLNDVGPEGGETIGTEVCTDADTGWGTTNCPGGGNTNDGYDNPPYYRNAFLKVLSFAPSGSWSEADCGSPDYSGKDWMRNATCDSPN
ncbi:MAG: cytochrome c3 family protein [Motiliproteus sp.]